MSTAGGPKLAGIGPGAAPEIVLCMDAHDAGSYPGEPTTNLYGIVGQSAQNNGNHTGTMVTGQPVNFPVPLAPPLYSYYKIVATGAWSSESNRCLQWAGTANFAVSTSYHMSFWARTDNPGSEIMYSFYGGGGGRNYATLTSEWQFFSCQSTTQATYLPLEIVSTESGGQTYYVAAIQVEDKTYATPYVQYGARPASTNLMIHGNVGTGTSFYDSSPSKHTVNVIGDVTHSNTKSKFSGGSFHLDGGDDYLYAADSDDWHVGSEDFTVDMWINADSYTNVSYPALYSQFVDDNNFLCLYFAGASRILLWGRNAGSGYSTLDHTGTTWTAGVWYHVALVRNGTTTLLFRDGVLLDSVTESWTASNIAGPLYVGWWGYATNYGFKGYMDEFRFTKGTALWTSTFNPPTRRNRNAPVVDLSGSNNGGNFATTAMTDVATYRDGQVIEPVGSAVWDFDGTDDYISLGDTTDWSFGTGEFAIDWWMKLDTTSQTSYAGYIGTYISKWPDGNWILMNSTQGDNIRMYNTDAAGAGGAWSAFYRLADTNWHHLCLTRVGNTAYIYVDGVQRATADFTGKGIISDDSNPLQIGRAGGTYSNIKVGAIRIYKGSSLSVAQVNDNFNAQRSRFKV